MTLAQAREARDEARKALAAGKDPGQLKRDAKLASAFDQANTFEAVARLWWGGQQRIPKPLLAHNDFRVA